MCFISISLAHRHKHIHKLFSFKTCSFHPLSLWLGSNYLFQVQQLLKVQFGVQLHFLINVLLVCLNCNRICPRSNPAMYISISLDCTCLTIYCKKQSKLVQKMMINFCLKQMLIFFDTRMKSCINIIIFNTLTLQTVPTKYYYRTVNFPSLLSGSLIQVPSVERGKLSKVRLGSLSLKKEGERQCFLFTKHFLICTRSSGGKLHLLKVQI